MTRPVLLAVDGNSLLHRAYHAGADTRLRARDGRATWAVNGVTSLLLDAVSRVGPAAVVVGFDDQGTSVRKNEHPHYKATRPDKPVELVEQIDGAIEMFRAAGIHVVVPPGLEADDVVASAGRTAVAAGWDCVIVTSDRDSFALIDDHTTVLRVLNGGIAGSPILTPSRLRMMYGISPGQYRDYASMRGDASDNLLGIRGIGQKTAQKVLRHYGSTAAAFAAVDADPEGVAAALGRSTVDKLADPDSRAALAISSQIMTMRDDLDLGLELTVDGGTGRLPLPAEDVKAVLVEWGFHTLLANARRLFCGDPTQQARVQTDPYEGIDLPYTEPPDAELDEHYDPYQPDVAGPVDLETVAAPHDWPVFVQKPRPRPRPPVIPAVQLELTLF